MLLIPSATGVERTDTSVDDLLLRLAELLPGAWIVAGRVASKPVSDTCRRGHTRPFDAIIVGDRMIFVLDIWSSGGLIANRQKSTFFARISGEPDFPEGWQSFRAEIEKLKAALHDRFEVEPGRVVPDKIWCREPQFASAEVGARADTADLRRFARAATRLDKASIFAPLHRKLVDRIVTFLNEDAKAAPHRPTLFFADESPTATDVPPTLAPSAEPAAIAVTEKSSRPASPALDAAPSGREEAAEPGPAAPARPSTRAELPIEPVAPISASEEAFRTTSPKLDAARPVKAETAETGVGARVRPSRPTHVEVALPPAAAIDSPPTPIAPREEASRRARATMAAAAPVIAKAAEVPATDHTTRADASLEQTAPALAFAPAQRRPTTHWKWLVGLLLLVVSQASTIAWLVLFDHASPHLEPAPHAALTAASAPAAPTPVPFMVRSLATSEPMRVGSETVTLRAGPSPDFPAVGELGAGTEVFANGRASGPGGATWIEILAVNGAIGFVPDNMVQPRRSPTLAIEPAASPKKMPTPEIERAAAPTMARKIERAVAPKPVRKIKRERVPTLTPSRLKTAPAPTRIACILPSGEEIQTPRADCRAQSGVIYQ